METIVLCQSMQILERRLEESLLGVDLVTSFFFLIASILSIILKFSEIAIILNGR